jgi:hypothetical protein
VSRPAAKQGAVAKALQVAEDQVPAKLRALHAATGSVRDVADYLTRKGVPTSKSWVHRTLATSEEDPS